MTRALASLRSALPILGGSTVVLLSYAWLSLVYPEFWATDDGIRDLLLARDCAEQNYCHTLGSPTSIPGLYQGAVWTHFLAAVDLLGGRTDTQRILVLVLGAVACGTLFVAICNWLRPTLAVPATALFAALLVKDHLPPQLASGGASALPTVLFSCGLLALALTGRIRFLLIASFAVAVAINEHVVSLALLPPLAAVSLLARRRPWHSAAIAFAVIATVCLLTSAAATRANLLFIGSHPLSAPLLVTGVLAAMLCARLGDRFRSLGSEARALIVGALTLLPVALGAIVLFAAQHHFSLHYLNPILAPAATIAAVIVCAPFEIIGRWAKPLRWVPTAAVLVAVGTVAGTAATGRLETANLVSRYASPWSLDEAEALADVIAKRGWSFDALLFRLQSVACRELIIRTSLFAPPPQGDGSTPVLQIVRRPHHLRSQPVLATISGDGGPIDVIEIDSWLVHDEIRGCREPPDGRQGRVCEDASGSTSNPGLLSSRSYPEIHFVDLAPPYRAIYEIPIRPVLGEPRRFAVDDEGADECGWRIVDVRGLEASSPLPATQTVVRSATGTTAWLTLAKPFGTPQCHADFDLRYPPCLLETSAEDLPPKHPVGS